MRKPAKAVVIALSMGIALAGGAQAKEGSGESFSHSTYARVLKRHVRDGAVDYAALKEDAHELRGYLSQLARVDPGKLKRDARMALFINAYNAFTLKLIIEYYPEIDSIKDIPDGFLKKKRWKDERWNIGGEIYSLDQIEHDILRPRFKDARVHFALVCAAKGCPDLLREPYVAKRLDEQLDAAGRRYLSQDKGMRLDRRGEVIRLSRIFDWFEGDFERDAGSVLRFVARFVPEDQAEFIRRHPEELDVEWIDYDWKLNDL